jgi:hypothetical protein
MSAFRIFQHAIMGNVFLQDFFPCGREGNCRELFPAAVSEPVKHRDSFFTEE